MPQQILLLSGNVSSGKTTLSESLRLQYEHIYVLKTKKLIQEIARKKLGKDIEAERRALQEFGTWLDERPKVSGFAMHFANLLVKSIPKILTR